MTGSRKQVLANKRAGRAFQAKAAKMLNAKNVGTIENQDLSHPLFSFEAKKRKSFLGIAFMNQATKNCPEGKIPLVIVHQTEERHENDLILIRFSDWEKMIAEFWDEKIIRKYKNK